MNKTRFWASFHRLQELGKRESGAYRVAWTQEDQEARQTLLSHLRSEGLCGYQDGAASVQICAIAAIGEKKFMMVGWPITRNMRR